MDKNFTVLSIGIAASPAAVFDFVAEPANVPRWAGAFSQVEGGRAMMDTPQGRIQIGLRLHANRELGTVDTILSFPDGGEGKSFSRVMENGGPDSAVFSFMLSAPPVPPGELPAALEAQDKQIADELRALKEILEGES